MLPRFVYLLVLLAVQACATQNQSTALVGSSNGGECAYKCNPLDIQEPLEPKSGSNTAKAIMGILFGMTNVMRAKVC